VSCRIALRSDCSCSADKSTPKLRVYRVQYGVAHLVTDDVGAFARIHDARRRRAVKEIQRPSVRNRRSGRRLRRGAPAAALPPPNSPKGSVAPRNRRRDAAPRRGPISEGSGSGIAAGRRRSSGKALRERSLGRVGDRKFAYHGIRDYATTVLRGVQRLPPGPADSVGERRLAARPDRVLP